MLSQSLFYRLAETCKHRFVTHDIGVRCLDCCICISAVEYYWYNIGLRSNASMVQINSASEAGCTCEESIKVHNCSCRAPFG